MQKRTVRLAEQLLNSVPKSEMADLIRLLEYYNRFNENERTKAMRNGSVQPVDEFLEKQVIQEMTTISKTASLNSYATTSQNVCRCCGR